MRAIFLLIATLTFTELATAEGAGSYSGNVKAEWNRDGRTMTLLEKLVYVDPLDRKWIAPKGHVVDGASIPRFAWTLIGGPFEGKYRQSSVIHDVGCDKHWAPWNVVHEVFYMGMITSGVEEWRAKIMYAAVYHFGPRWENVITVSGIPATQTPIARERALKRAEPGSRAEILSINPPVNLPFGAQTSRFRIRIEPPQKTMTQQQFEELKNKIEDSGIKGEPTPALDEIRKAG